VTDLRELARLHLHEHPHPGRPAHLAAASGLVARGRRLYVVADDELALGTFDDGPPGRLTPLADAPALHDHAERKKHKPDLESLAELPPNTAWPSGALLTLGSGSTERRERGWLIPLDTANAETRAVEISLTDLYAALRPQVADLNIEGVAIAGDRLWLAQRGNGAEGANALIGLALGEALAALDYQRALPPAAIAEIHHFELGEAGGVQLTFSDLSPLPDGRLVFCAVAEDSASTYHDGACVASAVGILDPHVGGRPHLNPLPHPFKIEGVFPVSASGSRLDVLLVADGDDPGEAAPLLSMSVELP